MDIYKGVMKKEDADMLVEDTIKILKSPDTVTSDSFIKAYNIIHTFCTEPTKKYEIKGAPIYNLLVEVAKNYTSNLESFTSVSSFNQNFSKFAKGVFILTNVYEYLERYYIKTCMMKRDSYVRKVEELFYFYYYINYVEKFKFVFEKLVLMEVSRIRQERSNSSIIKMAIESYRILLLCSDNEDRYYILKDLYLSSFKREVDCKGPISRVLSSFYRELSLALDLFDIESYQELSKKMVYDLASRSEEIISYILRKVEKSKASFHAYKILEILGSAYIEALVKKLDVHVTQKLELYSNFESIFSLFSDLNLHLEDSFNKNRGIRKMVREKFTAKINKFFLTENKDRVDDLVRPLIERIESMVEETDSRVQKTTFSFFNLIDKKDYILEKICFNLQKRLLFNKRDLKEEHFLVKSLMNVVNHEDMFKLKLSLNDMFFSQKFHTTKNRLLRGYSDITSEDLDFIIEPKFLTSGFWNIKGEETILVESLEAYKKRLIGFLKERNKRSFVRFSYTISMIMVEFNSFRLVLKTDTASVLLLIEKYQEISQKQLEDMTKDVNLNKNIHILMKSELIQKKNNFFFINYDYTAGDADLFSQRYKEVMKKEDAMLINTHMGRIMLIEAAIMRFMKKERLCKKSALFQEMLERSFDLNDVSDVIEKLKTNNYLIIEKDVLEYVP